MIAILATLPGRVVHLASSLRCRARFVDEDTETDQTPTAVIFYLRPPGGALATYTWTAPSTLPTLDATLIGFQVVTPGSLTYFEATVAIADDDPSGVWAFGWRALDAGGNELVTTWGAIDVMPAADLAPQPSPAVTPPNPYDELGAGVWSYGYPAGSFYYYP